MPSFDIVSKTDMAEIDNAINGVQREVGQRFDFKGAHCSLTRDKETITILADDETKLSQLQDMLKVHCTRRNVDPGFLEFKDAERAGGDMRRQEVTVRQGLDKELAKRLVKEIKDSKIKVQTAIQGDELRVTGKKRDELQDVIALVRGLKIEQPLQYVNFRE